MRKLAILLVLLVVVLASCKGGSKTLDLKPFIGGTSGLTIDFLDGQRAFDIVEVRP